MILLDTLVADVVNRAIHSTLIVAAEKMGEELAREILMDPEFRAAFQALIRRQAQTMLARLNAPNGDVGASSTDPAGPIEFSALLGEAIRRCDGESGLARQLGYNKNSIRQWRTGLALPDAAVEARLAALAGVTQAVMRRAIREAVMRRFDESRDFPPMPTPHRPRKAHS